MFIPQLSKKVKIFFSYAAREPKDKSALNALAKHLTALRQEGSIHEWYDNDIDAGSNWQQTIDMYINTADIIIFLLSADFLASEYWREGDIKRALERCDEGVARVISVILRPTDWGTLPFNQSNLLPPNHRPISRWSDKDAALVAVVNGIRKVVEELRGQLTEPFATPEQPKFPLREIPPRRNPFFTGREDILRVLHERFTSRQNSHPVQALSGIGGIGKTEIAVEYAYRHKDEYQAIFWVRADTHGLFKADITSVAKQLGLPLRERGDEHHLFIAVRQWLQQHDQWLLILDYLKDFSLVEMILPSEYTGHVLLTTRHQATGKLAASIVVMQMTIDEGASFLLRRTKLLAEDRKASATDYAQATAIAQAVDGFPLALDQAGAYIEETQKSLEEYLTLYQKRRAALLRRRSRFDKGHQKPVTATLSLAFKEVNQANRYAMELLRLFAFLHPDAIPDEMITRGAPDLNHALQALAADSLALDDAIAVLLNFSLVHRNADRTTLSIHRLVQAVLRDELTQEQEHTWALCVVGMVSRVFPCADFSNWPICYRYLPQAQVCADYITTFQFTGSEATQLLYYLGSYCYELAQYNEAEVYLTNALRLSEQAWGPDHSKTAEVLNTFGLLYEKRGEYQQAESLLLRALAIYEQISGPDHLNTTTTLNNLALLYYDQGKYSLAEPLYRRVLTSEEQALGMNHPNSATTLNNLALLYYDQGEYSLAEPLYQQALTIRESALEPGHPDLAQSLNNLALLYQDQAKYQQAEPLLQRALDICEQTLGPEHPDIVMPLNNMAQLYQAQESYQAAEALYRRAISINEHIFGLEHSSTAILLNNLALLYRLQGNYQQAETLYQRSLAICEKALGLEHPDTALALNNLGRLYLLQEQYQTSESLLQRAIAIYEQALGPNNPDTAGSLSNLAELYARQGKQQQAEQLYQRALAIEQQALGPDHPDVAIIMGKYALLLEQMQRAEDAIKFQQAAHTIKEQHSGKQ